MPSHNFQYFYTQTSNFTVSKHMFTQNCKPLAKFRKGVQILQLQQKAWGQNFQFWQFQQFRLWYC